MSCTRVAGSRRDPDPAPGAAERSVPEEPAIAATTTRTPQRTPEEQTLAERTLAERTLGLDIGGTKVVYALGDGSGELIDHTREPFPRRGDPRRDLEHLVDTARSFLRARDVRPEALRAVGVALPGPLDAERGVVFDPPNLPGWGEVEVRSPLAAALDAPVQIENDANAAALAEWTRGAGQGVDRMLYLTMSTGIGGGFILDGALYRGAVSSAGEIGHAPVEWEGLRCACGRRGCLEAYIGGAALTGRFREETPSDSAMMELAGDRAEIRPEHWLEAARRGDAYALAELNRYNDYLARAIVQLAFTLAPDCVVLGTIAVAAGEALCFGPVRERVRNAIWPFLAERLRIVPAALGDALPAHAALCAANRA